MSKIKQLEKYTSASMAVAAFKAKHGKVFAEFNALILAASEAEAALKTYVKEEVKGNVSNEFVKVTYSPAFSKFYDPATVLKMATPKLRKEMMANGALVIEEKVDKVKFTQMVEEGIVPVEIKQAAFREEELAPRVTIKENK
jgi:hypothetical protein